MKETRFLRPELLGLAPVLMALPVLPVPLLEEAFESLDDLLIGVLLLEDEAEEEEEEVAVLRGDAGGRRELPRDDGVSESESLLLLLSIKWSGLSGMEKDLLKVGLCFLLNSEGGRSSSALASWKANHRSYCSCVAFSGGSALRLPDKRELELDV